MVDADETGPEDTGLTSDEAAELLEAPYEAMTGLEALFTGAVPTGAVPL